MDIFENDTPCDRIDADFVAFALFTDNHSFTRSSMGLTDWRMNGYISRLYKEKILTGKKEEKTLLSTNGRIKARRILLFGLGKHSQADEKTKDLYFATALSHALKFKASNIALSLDEMDMSFEQAKTSLKKLKSAEKTPLKVHLIKSRNPE